MNKISGGQLLVLLLCCRIFRLMTFNPFENTSGTVVILSVIISAIVEVIIVIPLIVFSTKCQGKSVGEVAFERSKVFGVIISLIYTIFFVMASARVARYFTLFIGEAFPNIKGKGFISALFILLALYGAMLGIEALGRSSVFVFVLFVGMFVLMIATSNEDVDFLNFSMIELYEPNSIFKATVREIGMNSELSMLAVLIPHLKGNFKKTTYSYICIKVIVVEVILFFCTAILGSYLKITKLPLFAVGAYSKTNIIERFDAIYLVVWTLCGAISLGVTLFIVDSCTRNVLKKSKGRTIISATALLAFLLTFLFSVKKSSLDRIFDEFINAVIVVILACVLPLIVVLLSKSKKSRG